MKLAKFFYIVGFPVRLFLVVVAFPFMCMVEPNNIPEIKREMISLLKGEGV